VSLLGVSASGAWAAGPTAYVASSNPLTQEVVPIDLATDTRGTAIPISAEAIAITPDGSTAYVLGGNNTVTPIDLATNTPGNPIPVGSVGNNESDAIAITPDGRTAYVTNEAINNGNSTVTPIDLATNTPETSIPVGGLPDAIAITPDGETAYIAGSVLNASGSVTPIDLATGTAGTPISTGNVPRAVAITPDGSTAYVAEDQDDAVVPIDLATNTAGTPISVGIDPVAIAITPDGSSAYVANLGGTVVPIDLTTDTPGTPITVAGEPTALAIAPDGLSAYVASSGTISFGPPLTFGSGSVTPIDLATNTLGSPITVGSQLPAIAITPAVFGPPTATIANPAGNGTFTVGQTVTTSFSCTDASDGSGISSCKDSNRVTGGSGVLDTATVGTRAYTVTATSKDGRIATASIQYTVSSPTTTTSSTPTTSTTSTDTTPTDTTPTDTTPTDTTPTGTTPTTTNAPVRPGPIVKTKISQISLTANVIVWCRALGCRYPSTALQFDLNHAAPIRLVLRIRAHGHWEQAATASLHGHRGINRHRIAGRWHGRLFPADSARIDVQTRRGHQWTTVTTVDLTVRHHR
jgi:YVTN family beta-propeller protein